MKTLRQGTQRIVTKIGVWTGLPGSFMFSVCRSDGGAELPAPKVHMCRIASVDTGNMQS